LPVGRSFLYAAEISGTGSTAFTIRGKPPAPVVPAKAGIQPNTLAKRIGISSASRGAFELDSGLRRNDEQDVKIRVEHVTTRYPGKNKTMRETSP
jgi:hypothetical protein